MNEQPRTNKRIFAIFILVILLIIGGLILYYAYNRSFIEITVNNSSSGDIEYIINHGDDSIEFTESHKPVRKMVPRGSLQITAIQDFASGVVITKTSGFFQTTEVVIDLAKEKNRTFLGNNPKQCLHLDQLLLSWQCEGTISTASRHVPADDSMPTYASPITGSRELINIESLVQTQDSIYLLTKTVSVEGREHILYPVNDAGEFDFEGNIVMSGLSGDRNYRSTEYRNGWLFYSTDGEDFLYYEDLSTAPERIERQRPENENLRLYSVSVNGDTIVLIYNEHFIPETNGAAQVLSNNVRSDDTTEDADEGREIDRPAPQNQTEVVILSNEVKHHTLDFSAKQVRLCGQSLICALEGNLLNIFNMSTGSPEIVSTLPNVQQIEVVNDDLLVVTNIGLMKFDTVSQKGHYLYTFKNYRFCGLVTKNRLGICVEQEDGRSILGIDAQSDVKSPIDQLVYDLTQLKEIKAVTAYGGYVYISPNYGEPSFSTQINSYGFSDDVKNEVNRVIDRKVKDLGLSDNYQVKQTIR